MSELRSRLAQFVIDVADLDQGVAFWSAALDAVEETLGADSQPVYRRLKLPDSDIRILLQRTDDPKSSPKERMHLDLETNDVEAEVQRLEALGATRWDHQQERGHDFWVLRDPWDNEFCVLPPEFPELLSRRGRGGTTALDDDSQPERLDLAGSVKTIIANSALVGAFLYGFLFLIYNSFYSRLEIQPEDVGITSTFLLVRSAGFAVVVIILSVLLFAGMLLARESRSLRNTSSIATLIAVFLLVVTLLFLFVFPPILSITLIIQSIGLTPFEFLVEILKQAFAGGAWAVLATGIVMVVAPMLRVGRSLKFRAVVSVALAIFLTTTLLSIRASQSSDIAALGTEVESIDMFGFPVVDISSRAGSAYWVGARDQRPPSLFGDSPAPTVAHGYVLGEGAGTVFFRPDGSSEVYRLPANNVIVSYTVPSSGA